MPALVLAVDTNEALEPLRGSEIAITLAIIAAAVFFVVLAGVGYFSPDRDDRGE